MSRWLPHPGWSLLFVLMWLSLNESLSPGHVVLAFVVGIGLPLALLPVWPVRGRFRDPLAAFTKSMAFGALVLSDVVVANLQVARAVLSPLRRLQPTFFVVPLDLEDEVAIVVLQHTLTLTPGTVSVDVSSDHRELLVHALNEPDPAAAVRTIKQRYEKRIAEIFRC